MANKYFIGLPLILIVIFSLSVSAQSLNNINKFDYDRLKQEGKLPVMEYSNSGPGLGMGSNPNAFRTSTSSNNSQQASTSCNCWISRDSSFHVVPFTNGSGITPTAPDYRNDDWSSQVVNLPFTFCFYGQNISQLFINNNGNISIRNPYPTFSGVAFPDTFVMIAPFWADVDTRGVTSGLVYYSITPTHMIVQWDHVGYYNSQTDKLNTFQLIITNGMDPIIPIGQNINFCYQDMQWTTGSASQGVNGFGGRAATVGINMGIDVATGDTNYLQFGRFDTSGTSYNGVRDSTAGVDWLDNQSFNINACISTKNIPPVLNSLDICDTIRLCQNTTYQLTANYLSPEPAENTTINYFFGGMPGISVLSNTPGNSATLIIEIVGQTSNLGFHTISVTAIDNGTPSAATTSNFVIEVMPAPLPSFTFSPASPVQVSSPVQFTNTTPPGSLLTWNFGDGSPTSTVPSPQHIFNSPGTYDVVLTAMFPNGCITTTTQQVVVMSCSSLAAFTIDNICFGETSTVTFTGTAPAVSTFAWNFGSATVVSGSDRGPYELSWSAPGTYSVGLTVTEPACSTSVTVPVDVYAMPVASIAPFPQLCEGAQQTLNFDGTAGTGATYNWNFGSATVSSGSGAGPYNLLWNTPGNYHVSLVVSEHGCTDSTQIAVQVNQIPTADFTIPSTACANDVLNVSYTGSAGASANYTWDFNGGNIISGTGQGPFTVSYASGGSYSITLNVTENGCTSTPFIIPLSVTSAPQVSISPIPDLCVGGTGNISFTGIAGAGSTFNWNFGTATVISGSGSGPYVLQLNNAGTIPVQLSVTENGCTSQSSINITVYPIPTSDFVIDNSACIGETVTLNYSGTATSNANFTWSFGGGTVVSGSGEGPYSIAWNAPGTYNISLDVDEHGCISTQTNLTATVNPLPTATAGNDASVCSGVAVSLGAPSNPNESYEWSPVTNLNDATISEPVATPVNNGNANKIDVYIVKVTDANGCINTDTVEVESYPVPVIDFDTPPGQCIENNLFIFSAGSNIPVGVSYQWTFSPEANIPSSNQSDIAVKYSVPGAFPVTLSADYNGCIALPHADSVHVYPMPTADFKPQVTQGCEPLTVPFTNLSTGDSNVYSWDFHDGVNDNTEDPAHQFVHSGLYAVSLISVNKFGCTTDTIFPDLIDVFPMPSGQFVPNPPVANILSPTIQFQNYSTNSAIYTWEFGDADTSVDWSPSHTYSDTGSYIVTLMLESSKGCFDTIQGIVRVEDNFSFYIPNSFSPNDDGINDAFRGYGIAFRKYEMSIYDRWGVLIYRTDNYERPWDGKLKSGVIQNDTYVYRFAIIDQHNEEHTFVGNVSIIK
jgi:gliding motility-associated-like protein